MVVHRFNDRMREGLARIAFPKIAAGSAEGPAPRLATAR